MLLVPHDDLTIVLPRKRKEVDTVLKCSPRGRNGASLILTHGSYLVRLVVLSLQAYVAKDYPQADMSA